MLLQNNFIKLSSYVRGSNLRCSGFQSKTQCLEKLQAYQFYLNCFPEIFVCKKKVASKLQNSLIVPSNLCSLDKNCNIHHKNNLDQVGLMIIRLDLNNLQLFVFERYSLNIQNKFKIKKIECFFRINFITLSTKGQLNSE